MTDAAIIIESLLASYGDCLLVTSLLEDGTEHRILIDTGPDNATWERLQSRLAQIDSEAGRAPRIDLAIISHIDHDHIGNAVRLLTEASPQLEFGDIWFNGRRHLQPGIRGAKEGGELGDAFVARTNEWNQAFANGSVVVPDPQPDRVGAYSELPRQPGGPRITLL